MPKRPCAHPSRGVQQGRTWSSGAVCGGGTCRSPVLSRRCVAPTRGTGRCTLSGQRSIATVIGVIATLLLVWMVNPWVAVPEGLNQIVTIAFWVSAIALVVVLYLDARKDPDSDQVEIEGPGFTRFLFGNSRAGLFWLPIRLFLGFAWLEAGWHKFTGTGWMDGGTALQGFWTNAVAVPEEGHAADHLRLVPHVPRDPAQQRRLDLVRAADRVRRDRGRARAHLRRADRVRRVLRRAHEHVASCSPGRRRPTR